MTERRFVLSGGSGVGKSTIINLLKNHNYQTTPECWTLMFDDAKNNNCLEAFSNQDPIMFREKLMNLQVSMEEALDKTKIAFLDRSIIDNSAFRYYYNVPMSETKSTVSQYDLIFFPDPLPENQYQKTELCSYSESLRMHLYLKEFYLNLKYTVIDVPVDSPENRMKFILDSI